MYDVFELRLYVGLVTHRNRYGQVHEFCRRAATLLEVSALGGLLGDWVRIMELVAHVGTDTHQSTRLLEGCGTKQSCKQPDQHDSV